MDYTSLPVDLTDRHSCLVFIREQLGPYGLEPGSDVDLKLELEAGTDEAGIKVYRPYGRLAAILGRVKNTKHLNAGKDGAEFRDADKVIASWLAEQGALDAALKLTLPASPQSPNRQRTSFSRINSSF